MPLRIEHRGRLPWSKRSEKKNEARRKIAPTQRPRISKFFQKAVVIIKLFLGPSALGSSASEFFQDRTRACQCIAIGNLHAARSRGTVGALFAAERILPGLPAGLRVL